MGDLFQDFVFAKISTSLDTGTTTVGVDNVGQFPSNTVLAEGEFWLTIESTLAHPPTFEIVKLTSVDSTAKTITIVRGQGGTSAVAHDPGTYVKGGLTAAMLHRLRAGRQGTALPTADDAIYDLGERFTVLPGGQQYVYIGSTAGGWEAVSFLRASASKVTSSIAAGGQLQTTIKLAPGYRLYRLGVDRKSRIRLYATAAQQSADATRPYATDPTGEHGVMLDYSITQTPLTRTLSPVVDGVSLETTPVADIPMTVDNQDSAAGAVTVTMLFLRTE